MGNLIELHNNPQNVGKQISRQQSSTLKLFTQNPFYTLRRAPQWKESRGMWTLCLFLAPLTHTAAFLFIYCLRLTPVSINLSLSKHLSILSFQIALVTSLLPRFQFISSFFHLFVLLLALSVPLLPFSLFLSAPSSTHYAPHSCLPFKRRLTPVSSLIHSLISFFASFWLADVKWDSRSMVEVLLSAHTYRHSYLHYKAEATDAAMQHGNTLTGPSATTTTRQSLATQSSHGNKPLHLD